MANKIEQIASKKKAAQEKQDADVARFAKKVASEVALGLSDSALIGSIAELATSVAEAVVNSNQNLLRAIASVTIGLMVGSIARQYLTRSSLPTVDPKGDPTWPIPGWG